LIAETERHKVYMTAGLPNQPYALRYKAESSPGVQTPNVRTSAPNDRLSSTDVGSITDNEFYAVRIGVKSTPYSRGHG